MTKDEFRAWARKRWGDDLPAAELIRRIGHAVGSPPASVKKWWYGVYRVPGPVASALRMIEEKD